VPLVQAINGEKIQQRMGATKKAVGKKALLPQETILRLPKVHIGAEEVIIKVQYVLNLLPVIGRRLLWSGKSFS